MAAPLHFFVFVLAFKEAKGKWLSGPAKEVIFPKVREREQPTVE